MIYLFDTNAISDLLALQPEVHKQSQAAQLQGDTLAICRPVYYELLRGLLWKKAQKKQSVLRYQLLPQFAWVSLQDDDWEQAAQFWADAIGKGRQLADADCLLAALAHRLDAVIVSSDQDFDALPVKRQDWRIPRR